MLVEDAYNDLRTFLRTYLQDPKLRYTETTPVEDRKWIYPLYPRMDADFPRVSILLVDSSRSEIGLGATDGTKRGARYDLTFEISVWVKAGEKAILDKNTDKWISSETGNFEIYSGMKLASKLIDNIAKLFTEKRDNFNSTYGYLDVMPERIVSSPFIEEYKLCRSDLLVTLTKEVLL